MKTIYQETEDGLSIQDAIIPAGSIRKLHIDPTSGLVTIQFYGTAWKDTFDAATKKTSKKVAETALAEAEVEAEEE